MSVPNIGERIGRHELAARWVYGELTSPRFSHSFRELVHPAIAAKAGSGFPFDALDSGEVESLFRALTTHEDRKHLARLLGRHDLFECTAWRRDQLLQAVGVWGLGWLPLPNLLHPRNHDEQRERDKVDFGVTPSCPFVQCEPIIVVSGDQYPSARGRQIVAEGTARSMWFLTCPPPPNEILVWLGL